MIHYLAGIIERHQEKEKECFNTPSPSLEEEEEEVDNELASGVFFSGNCHPEPGHMTSIKNMDAPPA